MRQISYCEAINEAVSQKMQEDSSIFVYGIDVDDHKRIFGTTKGLVEEFGNERCFSTQLSEDAMTGVGIGASMNGLRPIHVHMRADFMLLAMNQISNMLSSCRFYSQNKLKTPILIRAIIGRGWGQGAQHSKSMFSTFAHIPGLKVITPTTPYDAKGMIIEALEQDDPVICFEHRWLYWQLGDVPEKKYNVKLEEPSVLKEGKDITIVATSWMCVEAIHAAKILENNGVSAEVIDLRVVSPLKINKIIESVEKTKNCIIADYDWIEFGVSSEILTQLSENMSRPFNSSRIGFKKMHCPTARHLENKFFPNAETIIRSAEKLLNLKEIDLSKEDFFSNENKFTGPF